MSKATTSIVSMMSNVWSGTRSGAMRILLVAGAAALVSLPSAALAQASTICGPEVKDEVARALASVENSPETQKGALQQELYEKYRSCAQDAELVPPRFYQTARQCASTVSHLGSLYYEEMPCVGYDPQRRQFAAPITIKRRYGYGAAPLPGSREYVLHCVADVTGTLLPVGRDSVHLANAIGNPGPRWQFAVITSAGENLQTIYPMDGQTRRARSILSWALPPTNCNYSPIWGNAVNYRIRLDQ